AFALYVALRTGTGNLFAIAEVTRAWGGGLLSDLPRVLVLPPANPLWFLDILAMVALTIWALLIIALLVNILLIRSNAASMFSKSTAGRLGAWGFIIYALGSFLITIPNNPMNLGWGRYMLVTFPCIWVIARSIKSELSL